MNTHQSHSLFQAFSDAAGRFWQSRVFFPLLLVCSVAAAVTSPMTGVLVLAALICFLLIFTDDILSVFAPLLMICLITLDYYDNYPALLSYWWIAAAVGASFCFHLLFYRMPVRVGPYFCPAVLVSAATLLAGLGKVKISMLLRPVSLYYSIGLGLGLLAIYVTVKSRVGKNRSYDPCERFAEILYAAGLMAGVMVIRFYCKDLPAFLETFTTRFFTYRNYVSTVMLMALPIPFYKTRYSLWHIAGALFIYFCLLLSGSRSGMLFGSFLLTAGFAYILWYRRRQKKFVLIVALLAIPFALSDLALIRTLFASRAADGTLYVKQGDSRIEFFLQSLKDFLSNPLFGTGLMNDKNGVIFTCVPGSMVWYHNYAAQVIGSMGMVGVVAYLTQMWHRFQIIRKTWEPLGIILTMSYCGMLMISMVNPGEFCPLPNAFLVTTLFALLEDRGSWPERSLKKKGAR